MSITPIATVKAYRRTGRAVVTVIRSTRRRRYVISLKRYHALREWTAFGDHPWKASGAWMKSSMEVYLWDCEQLDFSQGRPSILGKSSH